MEVPNSGERFNLKWNNHTANFVQVFAEHQNSEALVDVTLSCEGQYIKAHKLILSACSHYFHSIFQVHNMPPLSVILLSGVKFKDLKSIIQFMYHGEVKVLDADLPGVLALGQTLQVKGLSSVKLKSTPESTPAQVPLLSSTSNNVRVISKAEAQSLIKMTNIPTVGVRPDPVKLTDPILPSEIPKTITLVKSANTLPVNLHPKLVTKVSSNENVTVPVSNNGLIAEEQPSKKRALEENDVTDSEQNQTKKENIVPQSETISKNKFKPLHAFMIFARDWRPKLAAQFPDESTKEISLRMGHLWKSLQPEMKKVFYVAAKKAAEEHRVVYPNSDVSPAAIDGKKRKSEEISRESSPLDPLMMVEVDEDPICISEED